MSLPCHLLLCLWALLAGCAPAPDAPDTGAAALRGASPGDHPPPGWAIDPDAPHPTWTWGGDAVRVSVAGTEHGDRTRGLWIELGGAPLGARLPSGQAAPLLILTPRSDGTPPLRQLDGGRLLLSLAGSTEHGCPADAVEVALSVDAAAGRLSLLVHGVPYLLFDAIPVLVDREGATLAAVLPAPGESWESGDVRRVVGRVGGRAVRVGFQAAPPWLQLQRHGHALELDLDHGCEDPSFDASFLAIDMAL